MATVNLGRIKPVFRGAYSGSTAYVVDDIVTSGGSSYICIQAHGAGTQAVNQTAYWTQMAAGGTDVGTVITTQGDVLYRDGSGLQRLAKPASDMYLKNTSGGVLSWASLASDWVKIAQTNVTSSTSAVDFINGTGGVVIDSTYRIYKLLCSAHPVTNGDEFRIRLINGGSNVRTSGYLTEAHRSYYSGGTSRGAETNYFLRTLGGTQNTSEQRANFECTFYNMSDADHNTTGFANFCQVDGSGNSEDQVNQGTSGGVYATAEAHDGIRVMFNSGNISAGEFTLIGLKG